MKADILTLAEARNTVRLPRVVNHRRIFFASHWIKVCICKLAKLAVIRRQFTRRSLVLTPTTPIPRAHTHIPRKRAYPALSERKFAQLFSWVRLPLHNQQGKVCAEPTFVYKLVKFAYPSASIRSTVIIC